MDSNTYHVGFSSSLTIDTIDIPKLDSLTTERNRYHRTSRCSRGIRDKQICFLRPATNWLRIHSYNQCQGDKQENLHSDTRQDDPAGWFQGGNLDETQPFTELGTSRSLRKESLRWVVINNLAAVARAREKAVYENRHWREGLLWCPCVVVTHTCLLYKIYIIYRRRYYYHHLQFSASLFSLLRLLFTMLASVMMIQRQLCLESVATNIAIVG